jgi:chromosome partitioning protein
MAKLTEVVQLVQKRLNPGIAVTGIIPSLFDRRTNLAKEVLEDIESYFGRIVFRTKIRRNVKLAEAPSFGQHILEYAGDSLGAQDFRALAAEVLGELVEEDQATLPLVQDEDDSEPSEAEESAPPPPNTP